jgi:predicted PP-loop superfamily ATPase
MLEEQHAETTQKFVLCPVCKKRLHNEQLYKESWNKKITTAISGGFLFTDNKKAVMVIK